MTMSAPLRLAAFVAALVLVFGLAFGAGSLVDDRGPEPTDRATHSPSTSEESHDHVD